MIMCASGNEVKFCEQNVASLLILEYLSIFVSEFVFHLLRCRKCMSLGDAKQAAVLFVSCARYIDRFQFFVVEMMVRWICSLHKKKNQQFMLLGLHKNCLSRAEIDGVGNHVSGFGRI
jgi:hypothetical protein